MFGLDAHDICEKSVIQYLWPARVVNMMGGGQILIFMRGVLTRKLGSSNVYLGHHSGITSPVNRVHSLRQCLDMYSVSEPISWLSTQEVLLEYQVCLLQDPWWAGNDCTGNIWWGMTLHLHGTIADLLNLPGDKFNVNDFCRWLLFQGLSGKHHFRNSAWIKMHSSNMLFYKTTPNKGVNVNELHQRNLMKIYWGTWVSKRRRCASQDRMTSLQMGRLIIPGQKWHHLLINQWFEMPLSAIILVNPTDTWITCTLFQCLENYLTVLWQCYCCLVKDCGFGVENS